MIEDFYPVLAGAVAVGLVAWLVLRHTTHQHFAFGLILLAMAAWLITEFIIGMISGEVQTLARRGYIFVQRSEHPTDFTLSVLVRAICGLVLLIGGVMVLRKRPNKALNPDAQKRRAG